MKTLAKPQRRMIFVNLPVADLAKAQTFYAGLGFAFDRRPELIADVLSSNLNEWSDHDEEQ